MRWNLGELASLLIYPTLYQRTNQLPQGVGLILIQKYMSLQEAKMTSLKDKLEVEEQERVEALRLEQAKALKAAKKAKKKAK